MEKTAVPPKRKPYSRYLCQDGLVRKRQVANNVRIDNYNHSIDSIHEKNETSENKSASTISSAKTKDSDYENSSDYENRSDYEKSELYFHHRMEMVLKKKYPELISWRMTRQGVSLLNQAIEVVVTLPEEKKRESGSTSMS